MEVRNLTPFPTLAFEGIDQLDQPFHVVAMRQTFTWDNAGRLTFAEDQEPLCEADAYFGESADGPVRQESDLCQYKPRCDVIVNATGYAPNDRPARRFAVRLRVMRPDEPAPLPEPPRGLNPFQAPSLQAQREWAAACERARSTRLAGTVLIDKTLSVTGPRWLVRRAWPLRTGATLCRWATLGLVRWPGWALTRPAPAETVALRNDLTFGGQCSVTNEEAVARRIPKRHRLPPEQQQARPGAAAADAFAANPEGTGWAVGWYLAARRLQRLAAPQIEPEYRRFHARHFDDARLGRLEPATGTRLVAGFGVRPKCHPARAKLVGTIDQAFCESDNWLPEDFDFGVWNAAWPDQQVEALRGDEIIELTNLCAADSLSARRDAHGNTLLRLELPGHLPFVLVRFEDGRIGELAARLDTLIIEPDTRRVACVWRATLAREPRVRVLEARMLTRQDIAAMAHPTAPSPAEAPHG